VTPDTGEAVWAFQQSPHDLHDYDGVNENVLVDIPWKGQTRRRCCTRIATGTST
jgi:alcohol dehydrogenase (cytochrome c)